MKALAKRLKLILTSGVSRLIISFGSVIVSLVVVRVQSPLLWGQVVAYTLIIDAGFSIVGWGSSPYLLRGFSLHPKDISVLWNQSFSSRLVLLPFFFLFVLLSPIEANIRIWMCGWILSRYVYQSFEPVVQFHQHFIFSAIVEVLGLAIIVLPVLAYPVDVTTMVELFVVSISIKALIAALYYRRLLLLPNFSSQFFGQAFPFLLLTFSAMIQQRADLYSVAAFLGKAELARYQVFVNLLIFSQFVASLLLNPFAKNIFRASARTLLKMERSFALGGVAFSAVSLAAVYAITKWIYRFEYSPWMFVIGYFYVLTFYLSLLRIFVMGKQNKQIRAAIYSLVASGLNLILCFSLIPRYGMAGALLAGLLAQVLLVVLYRKNRFDEAYS